MMNYLKYLPISTLAAGILSHLILIICLLKDPLRCFRNSSTYLVANLAFADFSACIFGMMRMVKPVDLSIVTVISRVTMFMSVFSIFAIAIDRYMITVRPFFHRAVLNGKQTSFWVVIIWIVSSVPLAKYLAFGNHSHDDVSYHIVTVAFASLTNLIYGWTYFSLRKRRHAVSKYSRNRDVREEFLKTITIVAFIQFVTLVPANLGSIFLSKGNGNIDLISISSVIFSQLYSLNVAINPVLYIWRLKYYRKTFILVFCNKINCVLN